MFIKKCITKQIYTTDQKNIHYIRNWKCMINSFRAIWLWSCAKKKIWVSIIILVTLDVINTHTCMLEPPNHKLLLGYKWILNESSPWLGIRLIFFSGLSSGRFKCSTLQKKCLLIQRLPLPSPSFITRDLLGITYQTRDMQLRYQSPPQHGWHTQNLHSWSSPHVSQAACPVSKSPLPVTTAQCFEVGSYRSCNSDFSRAV